MRIFMAAIAVCLFLWALPLPVRAAEAIHGNVVLVCERGIARGDAFRTDVEFEFPVRQGNWPKEGWGYATWFSRGFHEAKLVKLAGEGDTLKLSLDVKVVGDHWVNGGRAKYEITVKWAGEKLSGSYTGSVVLDGAKGLNFPDPAQRAAAPPERKVNPAFLAKLTGEQPPKEAAPSGPRATEVSGKVTGRITAPWPELIKGHVPIQGGEHPRLIFRKAEMPRLKKLAAETPAGQAILAQAKAAGGRGPHEGDKFTTWPAVGYGFLYQMTGDRKHAEQARQIVDSTIFRNKMGRRGNSVTQDIHHGPRCQGLALAFDLCCDAWDEAYRLKCIDEVELRARELIVGKFEGQIMSGYNPNPWSNHNAIRVGCAALGALAVHGEKNSRGEVIDFTKELAVLARELREHYRTGLGKSGYCMEGGFYKVMTMQRGSVHGIHAMERAWGWKVLADLGDFDLVGYFMEASPGGTPGLAPVAWAVGLGTVPADMMPGIKYLHTRTVGLEGNRSFGIGHGLLAPYALATYPFDVEEKPPWESLRWAAPDENKGHYIIRPTWKDRSDIVLVMNLKCESLRGSWAADVGRSGPNMHLRLHGLGRLWLDGLYLPRAVGVSAFNPHQGAVITSQRMTKDRTLVIDMNTDRAYLMELPGGGQSRPQDFGGKAIVNLVYWPRPFVDFGIRGRRSMAIDCSGKSGSPLLVASVDRISLADVAAGPAAKPKELSEDEKKFQELLKKLGKGKPASRAAKEEGTVWSLPLARGAGPVDTAGRQFTIGAANGPNLAGVLVAPDKLNDGTAAASAKDGTYFVVFTLQDGAPPKFELQGAGLDAVVKVGGRKVRFAGDTLLLE